MAATSGAGEGTTANATSDESGDVLAPPASPHAHPRRSSSVASGLGAVLREVRQRDGVAGRWALVVSVKARDDTHASMQHWLVFDRRNDMETAQRVIGEQLQLCSPRRAASSFLCTVASESTLPASSTALAGGAHGNYNTFDALSPNGKAKKSRRRSMSAADATQEYATAANAEVVRLFDSQNAGDLIKGAL